MADIEGITPEKLIQKLIEQLKISPDREPMLKEIFTSAMKDKEKTPVDDLEVFISKTRKANELAFLCFVHDINVGSLSTMKMTADKLPELMNEAANYGARMASEQAPNLPTPPKEEIDRIYG
jgi:hypothetical protein